MSVYTTEIASAVIASDNPIHQRLLKAYYLSRDYISGNVLEVGCGEGRGVELIAPLAAAFTGIDKIAGVIDKLKETYPSGDFRQMVIPPFSGLKDNSFDVVVSFQVIEHIKDDLGYLREIYRVLKPGGTALITTPNIAMSLSRNPWHIREYTASELAQLAGKVFENVEMKGISGNETVMAYYLDNKKSVEKMMRWDVLDLQYKLPACMLKVPYEILNRLNRDKLKTGNDALVSQIHHSDYLLVEEGSHGLDLFCILKK
ncbi:MAG: class I SAM-dependent methyltransferase [Cyclobacteriaceae bacterium]|nr:class I SAM-dependent methyltransferase [Cyclobacteriaceae bacterium]